MKVNTQSFTEELRPKTTESFTMFHSSSPLILPHSIIACFNSSTPKIHAEYVPLSSYLFRNIKEGTCGEVPGRLDSMWVIEKTFAFTPNEMQNLDRSSKMS